MNPKNFQNKLQVKLFLLLKEKVFLEEQKPKRAKLRSIKGKPKT